MSDMFINKIATDPNNWLLFSKEKIEAIVVANLKV